MVIIYTTSNKHRLIENVIKQQFDQLLEICSHLKSKIKNLSRNVNESDYVRLEIERTKELVISIEQNIQNKMQEVDNLQSKNRYEQLLSVYQNLQHEVTELEGLIKINHLNLNNKKTINENEFFSNSKVTDEKLDTEMQFDFLKKRRERLNLIKPSNYPSKISRDFDPQSFDPQNFDLQFDPYYDDIVAKRLERLENMLDEQK